MSLIFRYTFSPLDVRGRLVDNLRLLAVLDRIDQVSIDDLIRTPHDVRAFCINDINVQIENTIDSRYFPLLKLAPTLAVETSIQRYKHST